MLTTLYYEHIAKKLVSLNILKYYFRSEMESMVGVEASAMLLKFLLQIPCDVVCPKVSAHRIDKMLILT
jgi:hypothetical protein